MHTGRAAEWNGKPERRTPAPTFVDVRSGEGWGRGTVYVALVGIILLGLNMRGGLTTVAPIAPLISGEIALGTAVLVAVGMLSPLAFAVFGLITAPITRRLGLEGATILAISCMVAGHLGRGLAPEVVTFLGGGVVLMSGIGIANVLLPALIKRYFPRRIQLMSAVGAGVFSIGTAIPAAAIHPLAEAFGWRWALGCWALLALVALPPWIGLLSHHRSLRGDCDPPGIAGLPGVRGRVYRSPVAWWLLVIYAAMGINLYAMFNWLPAINQDIAGVSPFEAGMLLAVFALMGLVVSLILSIVAPRLRDPGVLVHVATGLLIVGYGGLLLAPAAAPWLWAVLYGAFTPTLYQVSLMLIGLRTRTEAGTLALSAFVQGFGFAAAAAGPLIVGLLHELTSGWTVPLVTIFVLSLGGSVAVWRLRGNRMVEDDWTPSP